MGEHSQRGVLTQPWGPLLHRSARFRWVQQRLGVRGGPQDPNLRLLYHNKSLFCGSADRALRKLDGVATLLQRPQPLRGVAISQHDRHLLRWGDSPEWPWQAVLPRIASQLDPDPDHDR